MFFFAPWSPNRLWHIKPQKHDSLFDPDTLLESLTSFQAFFGAFSLFKKRPPMEKGIKFEF